MTAGQVRDMRTNDELIAEQLRADPAFRAEWERTEVARTVAVAIVRYRADRDLDQRGLADLIGIPLAEVARVERGDSDLNGHTVAVIAARLGIELAV